MTTLLAIKDQHITPPTAPSKQSPVVSPVDLIPTPTTSNPVSSPVKIIMVDSPKGKKVTELLNTIPQKIVSDNSNITAITSQETPFLTSYQVTVKSNDGSTRITTVLDSPGKPAQVVNTVTQPAPVTQTTTTTTTVTESITTITSDKTTSSVTTITSAPETLNSQTTKTTIETITNQKPAVKAYPNVVSVKTVDSPNNSTLTTIIFKNDNNEFIQASTLVSSTQGAVKVHFV